MSSPSWLTFPDNLLDEMMKYNELQKVRSERMLLNHFSIQVEKFDPDIIVGHNIQGYFIEMICKKLALYKVHRFSEFGRLRSQALVEQTLKYDIFVGRMVFDLKILANQFIKCRSYNMQSLCETVLKISDFSKTCIDYESDQILAMYENAESCCQLASFTIQEAIHISDIMFRLNIIPTVVEITNIAGNVMSKNLLGGRYQINEFLLLHAFTKRNYIVPDKEFKSVGSKKLPTYIGGLVLEPKIGFYDKYVLLMDFNSLYPSIIQEYNICFTTKMPPSIFSEPSMVHQIPDSNFPTGVLPEKVGELLESRRQLKILMNDSTISNDLKFSYNVRQMAIKLIANSLYGCLGLPNSRFCSRDLASFITFKGREILRLTEELVTKMDLEVIYGDTDSIMINTKSVDYDQVVELGGIIKEAVNKMYKKVQLDIEYVFKYLLLQKKKRYAAVVVSKSKDGILVEEHIYKGIEIVRSDWSRLASDAAKFVLDQIFSDQNLDCCVKNIFDYLKKIKKELENKRVPYSSLVIIKHLTKNLDTYNDNNPMSHVQAALRFNNEYNGHLKAGDIVPYIICQDVTDEAAENSRAYHVAEVKANANLEIDIDYYLSKQIYPVVSRICNPIKKINDIELANTLVAEKKIKINEDIIDSAIEFAGAEEFTFLCQNCKQFNIVDGPLRNGIPVLSQCQNPGCTAKPVDYIFDVLNQMEQQISICLSKYYKEPSYSSNQPRRRRRSVVQREDYSASDLMKQLKYFYHIFDLEKLPTRKIVMLV